MIGRVVSLRCCTSPILFNLYGEGIITEVEHFKNGGKIVNKVRSADDTAIRVKTQEDLQDMMKNLVDTGSKNGIETNIDISQVMRVSLRKD